MHASEFKGETVRRAFVLPSGHFEVDEENIPGFQKYIHSDGSVNKMGSAGTFSLST